MCLAYPGKIIKIKNDQQATADFNGVRKDINISLVKIKVGDFVIVHAGFAIQKMGKEEAVEALKIYGEYNKKN